MLPLLRLTQTPWVKPGPVLLPHTAHSRRLSTRRVPYRLTVPLPRRLPAAYHSTYPVTVLRPKVLMYGHETGSPDADRKLREVATVVSISREPANVARDAVRDMADKHGTFVAVGVSVSSVFCLICPGPQ
jgi:hypothetical protein